MDGDAKTAHVLRPHHLNLCVIMHCAFGPKAIPPPGGHVPRLSAGLQLHVYRVLLREISEAVEPTPYAPLLEELESSPHIQEDDGSLFLLAVRQLTQTPGMDHLGQLVRVFELSVANREEEGEATYPIARRSLFGYFLRRCILSFNKLSFAGVAELHDDFVAWRDGKMHSGYQPRRADQLDNDTLLFKLKNDKRSYVQTEPYAAHEEGWVSGDEIKAADSLRAYFEQHFHDGLDSGFRQHALLQHSRMHYQRGEYAEARRLLREAITLCRTKSDKETLMHCMSLLHLLPPVNQGQRPVLSEIQPELHPLSLLNDAGKLLEEDMEQPLTVVFQNITQAVGLYDHYCEVQGHIPIDDDQWSQHLVQSLVWDAAGRTMLGALERGIFMAFSQNSTEYGTRMTAAGYQAYELARQGQYNAALALLLDPEVWRRIHFADYETWATEVWHVLTLKASRRGMHRVYREVLAPRRPCQSFSGREYWFDAPASRRSSIARRFFDVLYMRRHEHGFAAMEQLLTGLWRAEYQCCYGIYRTGITLLADVGLDFGLSFRSRTILEEIMPQIHASDDPEQKAFAFFTMARCVIVAGSSTPEALQEAVPWLTAAEEEYGKISVPTSLADVQFFLSVVYHNLGNLPERDAAAQRNIQSERLAEKLSSIVIEDEALDVWKLVTEIGAALSMRY